MQTVAGWLMCWSGVMSETIRPRPVYTVTGKPARSTVSSTSFRQTPPVSCGQLNRQTTHLLLVCIHAINEELTNRPTYNCNSLQYSSFRKSSARPSRATSLRSSLTPPPRTGISRPLSLPRPTTPLSTGPRRPCTAASWTRGRGRGRTRCWCRSSSSPAPPTQSTPPAAQPSPSGSVENSTKSSMINF